MLRLCLDKADQAGLPVWLVSFPAAHGLYLPFGFKDLAFFDTDLSKWGKEFCGFGVYRCYGMCRQPA